jgi:hypothetical protein
MVMTLIESRKDDERSTTPVIAADLANFAALLDLS